MDAPFCFDRYRGGKRMAEGIKINKASTLREAIPKAAALATPGDVVVLRLTDMPAARIAELEAEVARLREYYDAREAFADEKTTGNGRRLMTARAALNKDTTP